MGHEKLHRDEVVEGMLVRIDGLECVGVTTQRVQKDGHRIYVECEEGKHYIDLDEDTDNEGYFYELFKVADGVDLYEAGSPRPSGAERNRPMDPQKEQRMTEITDRTPKDYAIEFGGYLAKAADKFLEHPEDWEYGRKLRSAVYEFRKRAERAKEKEK